MRKFQFDAWAIFIAVIFIVAILWGLLLHFERRSEISNLDPFALIPSDAWLVVDVRETNEIASFFLSDSLAWNELKSLQEVYWFSEKLSMLDSLISISPDLEVAFKKARVLVSVHTTMRGEMPVLLQVRFNPDVRLRPFQRMIEGRWEQGSGQKASDFLGVSVFLLDQEDEKPVYATFYKGSLLLSPGKRLIEHAITQDISGSALVTSSDLEHIREVSGKRANNVFFDGHRLCEVFELFLTLDSPSLMPCEAFSGWMGWDLVLLGEEIRLTGFARNGKDQNGFLEHLQGQTPSDPFLLQYIPSATAGFAILNQGKPKALADSLRAIHSMPNGQEPMDSAMFARLFPFLGRSMASVMLYAPGMKPEESCLSLVQVNEPQRLWDSLSDLQLWGGKDATLVPADTVFDQVIWQFSHLGLIQSLTRGLLPAERPFVALRDSVLLAGTSSNAVKQALMQIHYGQVIGKEPRLSEDFIFQQPASNVLYMVNVPYLAGMLKADWQTGVSRLLAQIGGGAFPLDRLTAQFASHRDGLFFSNVSLHSHSAGLNTLHRHLWELKLDTVAHTSPFSVKNHVDGSKEIIIQDMDGNLYLVDRFGQALWKKPINGLASSSIYQVDRYKNGRLQYLFSTPSHIHLIDRNGKDVEGYPRRLPVKATWGITVLDYDGDRNYRILFTGDDLRVYNLDIDGRRLSGWSLPKLKEPAGAPLQYLKLGSRDYLLVLDEAGKAYFFDRRGKVRLNVPQAFRLVPQNPIFTLQRDNENRFVALGIEGNVLQMDEKGELEAFALDSLQGGAGFLFLDRGSGEPPAYIFTYDNKLLAFDRLGTPLFSQELSGGASLPLKVIRAREEDYIGLTTTEQGQLYLFDREGELVAPFPIRGEKGFFLESLLQDQSWNLVTVEGDRLMVYLLSGFGGN
ncbi:MAG: hypothetical protein V2I46_10325 [Bacteroides sp.]|jgi:hypothetical protein|nr:hypothetical protein [Bacteroides sp.]